MKKLLLVMSILLVCGGCYKDYNDMPIKRPISGTGIVLGSAQWAPALIHIDSDILYVREGSKTRGIVIIHPFFHGLIIIAPITSLILLSFVIFDHI